MARLIFPDNFSEEQKLFTTLYLYHMSLKTKSPLIIFLKQQNLDIVKLQAAVQPAKEQDDASLQQGRTAELNTQLRDANMKLPWKHFLEEVQFLKKFYQGNGRELGDWFIPLNGMNKIAYPASFADRAKLMQDFLGKHNSYAPGESPLQIFLDEHEDILVADDLQSVANAVENDADKSTAENASQLATQTRDNLWAPVVEALRKIGAFLMGLYAENSRKMQIWGFEVVEETAGPREQITTILPATTKNLSGIKVPSIAENIGNEDLLIVKGTSGKGEVIILKAGAKLGMVKGFSRISVTNASTLEIGKLKVIVTK
jgi:hypothetical protein